MPKKTRGKSQKIRNRPADFCGGVVDDQSIRRSSVQVDPMKSTSFSLVLAGRRKLFLNSLPSCPKITGRRGNILFRFSGRMCFLLINGEWDAERLGSVFVVLK